MNRLNKTKSDLFKLRMLCLFRLLQYLAVIISNEQTQPIKPRLLFSNFGCCVSKGSLFRLDITTTVVVPCGGPKSLPVHPYSVVVLYIFWSFRTIVVNILFRNAVALSPGLGGVRDVAYVIISNEQTKNMLSAVFKLWLCLSKGSLFRVFHTSSMFSFDKDNDLF